MEIRRCLFVVVGILALAVCTKAGTLDRLTNDLLTDYNKINLPDTAGINVSLSVQLINIKSLEDNVLTLNLWVAMSWVDKRFKWNPLDYDGITEARIPANMIWVPDIVLYNSAEQHMSLSEYGINTVINNEGNVTFVPSMVTKTYCAATAESMATGRKFPCQLKFGSWTYHRQMVDMFPLESALTDSNEFQISNLKYKSSESSRVVAQYSCCPEEYVTVRYTLTLKYRPDKMDKKGIIKDNMVCFPSEIRL